MKKLNKRIVIIIIATVAGILFWLVGSVLYITKYKIHEIDTSVSSDGKYELILQQVGDPDWPFGSTHARVVLKNDNNIITKYRFDVSNDGAKIGTNSWTVDWNEKSVDCVIYAEEQSDQLYRIFFDGRTESRTLDTHYGVYYEYHKSEDEEENHNSVDEEGYPIDEEWQAYKKELLIIADTIESNSDFDVKCYISAKGYPYAILKQEINETTGEKTEYHLIFNEGYVDSSKHEYVLEEYIYSTNGEELPSPTIIDFYLIDCSTLEVTDEQIDTWH